jgi:hypothetical protein
MFRDYRTGGYNIEGTGLKGERLIKINLLMAIAYISAMVQGTEIQKKQVEKYISRSKEPRKKYLRRSTFGIGQDGEQWVNYLAQHSELVQELISLSCRAFKLHILRGRDAHPTRVLLFFEIQFKCRTA